MKDMPFAAEWAFYDEWIHDLYERIMLPTRATSGSAGYDFKSPFDFVLAPGATLKVPTGIRARIDEGWWLGCLPRSRLGFKYRLQLDNTMGVIDSDYYHSDNERHIFLKLTNDSKEGETVSVKQGEEFAQAISVPYGIIYDDRETEVRNGGIGSTDRSGVISPNRTPGNIAFCVAQKDESILHTQSDAVMNALRRIRKAETATGTIERLNELDKCIAALEDKTRIP